MVWGYALVWFLVTDRVKLLAYRILDRTKAEPVSDSRSAAGAARKPVVNAAVAADVPPQIATGRMPCMRQGVAVTDIALQDWQKAEQEIGSGERRPK